MRDDEVHWGSLVTKAKSFGSNKYWKLGQSKRFQNPSEDGDIELEKELFPALYVSEKHFGAWPRTFTVVQ